MLMRFQAIAALLVTLTIATVGCSRPTTWRRADIDQPPQVQRDDYECRRNAATAFGAPAAPNMSRTGWVLGFLASGGRTAPAFNATALYEQCMRARGYQQSEAR